jgi:hypothetical protein
MKLSSYLSGVLSKFKDSRVLKNVTKLIQNIIEHKSIQLWSISKDKAEFERSKRLLDGSLKSILNENKTSEDIRKQSVAALANEARLILLHDPCDIRKADSEVMENIGTVRDLDGNTINGYSTFNTVAVTVGGKNLHLTDTSVYSNGDEHYVTVEEEKQFENGKLQNSEDEADRKRAKKIEKFMEEKSQINLPRLTQVQLKRVSESLKEKNPTLILCHVLDRQFDGVSYFEFIDQKLNDEFVIRAKISRNSNEIEVDEETDETVAVKLKDVEFAQGQTYVIDKLKIKKKVYQNAKCLIEWGTVTLDGNDYGVVLITLSDREGKQIYEHPMLLITNTAVKTAEQAREIYSIYLMRAKIEAVFKFLKDVLGWEGFQVRDYESIKNIIALCYFVGGHFYEIGSELTKNPTIELIAQLGGGKGKVTRRYFLEGLKKLLIHKSVECFVEDQKIGEERLAEMVAFVT